MNQSKTLFKITSILCLISAIFMVMFGFFVFFPFIFAVPLFFAYSAFNTYANSTTEQLKPYKNAMLNWSIFLLIFFTVAGVLALVGYIQVEKEMDMPETTPDIKEVEEETLIQKIQRLVSLKERGIINEEEFKTLKEKLINKEDN